MQKVTGRSQRHRRSTERVAIDHQRRFGRAQTQQVPQVCYDTAEQDGRGGKTGQSFDCSFDKVLEDMDNVSCNDVLEVGL
jgi:hypothetical protein